MGTKNVLEEASSECDSYFYKSFYRYMQIQYPISVLCNPCKVITMDRLARANSDYTVKGISVLDQIAFVNEVYKESDNNIPLSIIKSTGTSLSWYENYEIENIEPHIDEVKKIKYDKLRKAI